MTKRPNSEWFAKQLGERWQTSGDGIYRLAADQPQTREPELADDLERSLGVDPRLEIHARPTADDR